MKFSLRFFLLTWVLLHLAGAAMTVRAQAPQVQWVDGLQAAHPLTAPYGGAGLHRTTIDRAGNVYACFGYSDSVLVGGQPHYSPLDSSLGISRWALVKYGPTGQVLWIKDNVTTVPSGGLRTDAAGNLYCWGGLTAPYTLDGDTVDRTLGTYAVTKFSPNGTLLWRRPMGSPVPVPSNYEIWPSGVHLDPITGDILFAGTYFDSAQVGSFALAQPIVTRYHGNRLSAAFGRLNGRTGAIVAASTVYNVDSAGQSAVSSMGTDAAGNRYLIGIHSGTIRVGNLVSPAAAPGQTRTFWAKFSSAGQAVLLRTFEAGKYFIAGAEWTRATVAPDGFSYVICSFREPLTFGGVALTPAVPGQRDGFVARLDPSGVVQQVQQLSGLLDSGVVRVRPLGISVDTALGRLYVAGARGLTNDSTRMQNFLVCLDLLNLPTKYWEMTTAGAGSDVGGIVTAGPGGQLVWGGRSDSERIGVGPFVVGAAGSGLRTKSFVAKLAQPYNLIEGEVFVDANANGVRDAGEGPYPFSAPVVELTPTPLATPLVAPAGPGGHYTAQVGLGTFTAALPNPPRYYTAVTVGGAATFGTYGNVAAGRSFALQPIANQQDVQVVLTLVSPARRGSLVNYHVQYRNVGTVAIPAGTVTLTPDGRLLFQSSTQPATGAQVLTWPYANLLPGQTRHFNVVFRLPASAPLGVALSSIATIYPLAGDLAPGDNVSEAMRVVTGSFDPNDISVDHVALSTAQVASSEWLEYTIRFQNHGTDTAFTVLLRDTLLVSQVQMASFQMLAASHDCAYGFNQTGAMVFNLTSALLPPQVTNFIGSEGFVRFRVRTRPTLVAGDQIPNQASIFFDYNPPLATNVARTDILGVTGLSAGVSGAAVVVWPNPTGAGSTVRVSGAAPAATLVLTDLCGRPVGTATATARGAAELPTTGLAAGVYVLRGASADGGATFARRVVVR